MRVLYFHQYFSTPAGATGLRSYEMARRLVNRGHHVTMVCGSTGVGATGLTQPFIKGVRRGMVDDIEVIEFDLSYSNADHFVKRMWTFARYALRSLKLSLTERYDLIFATTTPLTAAVPGIVARWIRRKPFVFEVRDLWPELPREMGVITNPLLLSLMSGLEWSAYHSAHRLIGLAPGIVSGIERRGIPADLVAMIPNGCDMSLFERETETWRPVQVKHSDLLAVFAGTHGLANGLDAVLDGALELKSRGRSDIKLLLIGEGKCKPDLQRRAAEHKLDNVVFHEPVSKHRLAALLRGADVGLQVLRNVPAFYFGTSPNKFFDYIAAGLPVLNNYPGWLAELIEANDCGYAVPPDDPVAFADALEHAADNREALQARGVRARNLAKQEFDRSALADRFVEWLVETPSRAGSTHVAGPAPERD